MVVLRPASIEDAERIAETHVASWRAAYAGLLPREYLDGLRVAQRAGLWRRQLSHPERVGVIIAEADERLVGFVCTSASRDEGVDRSATGEVVAIYVHPEVWGTGVGRLLMRAGRAWLADRGFRRATLWVLTDNAQARAFYAADGWSVDGTTKLESGRGFTATEVRYERPLP